MSFRKTKSYFKSNAPQQMKSSAMKTAKKALKLAKKDQTEESIEYNDTALAFTASKVPAIVFLQPPTTDGFKQIIQYIEGKIYLRKNLTSVITDNYRVDLVLDRAPAGIIIDPAKIYSSSTPRITAQITLSDKGRYKICKSWFGAFDTYNTSRSINFYCRSSLKTEADSQTPAQASILKNAYYLIFWTEASANMPLITYDIQIVSNTT